ncbi:hypothetical protein [Rhodopila sp.]|uniref:hypothetical protein n=1 Tax=Rhodopila sp. TaxID=2480087 RepID=UPI003D13AF11
MPTTQPFITTPADVTYSPDEWDSSIAATIAPTVAAGYNLITLPTPDPSLPGLMIENLSTGDIYLRISLTSAAALVGPPGSANAGGRLLLAGYHTTWLSDIEGDALYLGIWSLGVGTINVQRFK